MLVFEGNYRKEGTVVKLFFESGEKKHQESHDLPIISSLCKIEVRYYGTLTPPKTNMSPEKRGISKGMANV